MLEDAVKIAEKGTHCGMCKFDFLGTGVCQAGKDHGFIAYWPEGRMELVLQLARGNVKPTQKLKEIAESCTDCGKCDVNCHFTTYLRPMKVAQALKEYSNTLSESDFVAVEEDAIVKELQAIVGEQWATNDPIILASYRRSVIREDNPSPFYVVMPKTAEEVAQVVSVAKKHDLSYLPRGNGSFLSMALQTLLAKPVGLNNGIIIDLGRMKDIEIDREKWTATVGAGVTAFDLQQEAYKHKMRALTAEAEAYICSNIPSFGIISTWGNTYGWGSDNFINVELVDEQGAIHHHNEKDIPNPYATNSGFTNLTFAPKNIVTQITVKLHPVFDDEESLIVPFDNLEDAYDFARNLAQRDIGLSLAVLSSKYLSEFICPTNKIAEDFDYIAKNYLKMNYVVDIVADQYDRKTINELADVVIDHEMAKTLILGAPRMASLRDSELLKIISEEPNPLKAVFAGPLKEHLIQGLDPTAEQIAQIYDEDLQPIFKKIYDKPEMSNSVWLHAFRILPSRLLRQKMFMLRGGYMAADKETILAAHQLYKEVGDKHNLQNDLGFISFLEHGKLAFLEYDYYYDHNNPDDKQRLNQSIVETLSQELKMKHIVPVEYVLHKGLHRKEHLFYPLPQGITDEELQRFGEMVHAVV